MASLARERGFDKAVGKGTLVLSLAGKCGGKSLSRKIFYDTHINRPQRREVSST